MKKQVRKNQNENLFLIFLSFFFFNYYFLQRSSGFRGLRSNGSFFFFLIFFNYLWSSLRKMTTTSLSTSVKTMTFQCCFFLSSLIHSYPFTTFMHGNSRYKYNEKRVVYNFIRFSFFIFNTT